MNWHLMITDGLYNEALFYEEDKCLGSIRFNNLKDFLKFLSILPNNRIKINNPCVLVKKGVPIEISIHGKISKTNTIRKLSAEGHSPKMISELTGMSEKLVWEIHSRLKRNSELN
jgi:hypothetical protein